jgi:hypothetical protein
VSRQTIAVSVKASKLTARALAYVVAAVGRKIAKEHRKAQTPHGKQSVRKLMGHGGDTNAIEVDTPKLFDKVARKWGVDYAIRRVGDEKYLLLFKARQADAITACFSEYSRKVLDKAKSRQPTIPEQMKQAEQQLAKEKPPKEHIKEVAHDR